MKLGPVVTKDLSHEAGVGNTTAVIVALPMVMDPIRLVGDEEKHSTLLYFGETSSLPDDAKSVLQDTVQQVSQMVEPFGERIMEVSRLGDEDPPALVAMLSDAYLTSIRNILQVNPAVRGYLSNAEQHPQFTPHVTLSYPDYKGEAELRKMLQQASLRRIGFDRLALWWNDERLEFPLQYRRLDQPMAEDAGWSADLVDEYLEHFGVKGMRWGFRKDKAPSEPASEEAVTTATTRARTKAAKGSTHMLTNKELQDAITRIRLEQQYSQMTAKPKSKGRVWVTNFFKQKKNRDMTIQGVRTAHGTIKVARAMRSVGAL